MAAASPPTGVSSGELVRWTFEVLNTRDVEPLRQVRTNTTVERFPSGTVHGADAMAECLRTLFAAPPDFHVEVVAIAETGDDVFVHWRLTGTHTGAPFEAIEATGRAVAIDGMERFVIRDGTIATNFLAFDRMQFARQIGLLPPGGSAADRATRAAFNARTRLVARVRGRRRS